MLMSPYRALFGKTNSSYIHYQAKHSLNQVDDSILTQRGEHFKLIKEHLHKAQRGLIVEKHKSERRFKVGDMVLLKMQPYKQL